MEEKQSFDGQRPNETVVGVFRRTYLWLLKLIFLPILLFILGLMLSIKFIDSDVLFVGIVLMVVALLIIASRSMTWYYSIYIITNKRIRFVNQKGWFRKAMVDIELGDIENSTCQIPGFLGDWFKFGQVMIDSKSGQLEARYVSRPEAMFNLIQDQISAKKGY